MINNHIIPRVKECSVPSGKAKAPRADKIWLSQRLMY